MTEQEKVKATANALVDRYDGEGALEVARRTWRKYYRTPHGDFYEKVWWWLVDHAPGDVLAKVFSTEDLAMIACAKGMRKRAS